MPGPDQPPSPLSKPEADLARLKKMLRRVLGNDEAAIRRVFEAGGAEALRILDIACGDCREADALGDALNEIRAEKPDLDARPIDIQLTGIDVRTREIAEANRRFGGKRIDSKTGAKREARFLAGDASKLQRQGQLGEGQGFDLVFLRHQNYWNGERTWDEIFDQALRQLDEEGRLVITSYFDREHQLAVDAIQRLGGELIVTEQNEESRALEGDAPGKSIDRHVAVFRKKDD
ncbi:MAG: class I SAM-dependent methyltransferase [Verrucomicrobiae bacterium]|nr:class I SAM-dependent methyltransferase [Verrucomicrobiae bacterium]